MAPCAAHLARQRLPTQQLHQLCEQLAPAGQKLGVDLAVVGSPPEAAPGQCTSNFRSKLNKRQGGMENLSALDLAYLMAKVSQGRYTTQTIARSRT